MVLSPCYDTSILLRNVPTSSRFHRRLGSAVYSLFIYRLRFDSNLNFIFYITFYVLNTMTCGYTIVVSYSWFLNYLLIIIILFFFAHTSVLFLAYHYFLLILFPISKCLFGLLLIIHLSLYVLDVVNLLIYVSSFTIICYTHYVTISFFLLLSCLM